MCSEKECADLRAYFPGVQRFEQGGTIFYFVPNMPMPDGCTPEKVDVLLCPTERDGYPSRLYFAERVQSKTSPNWNGNVRIIERNWHAYSWKIDRKLPLLQLLLHHLRALG